MDSDMRLVVVWGSMLPLLTVSLMGLLWICSIQPIAGVMLPPLFLGVWCFGVFLVLKREAKVATRPGNRLPEHSHCHSRMGGGDISKSDPSELPTQTFGRSCLPREEAMLRGTACFAEDNAPGLPDLPAPPPRPASTTALPGSSYGGLGNAQQRLRDSSKSLIIIEESMGGPSGRPMRDKDLLE
mmetsp:Transcript_73635/g.157975  ORF Transcript_73635/g.157975 Transcript_73635/m.157975 type:complete len:184 (-) Transcript_73635:92-643(-)